MTSNTTLGYLGKLCRMVTYYVTGDADALHVETVGYPAFLDHELPLIDPRKTSGVAVYSHHVSYGRKLAAWLHDTDPETLFKQMATYALKKREHGFLLLAAGFHGGSGHIAAKKFIKHFWYASCIFEDNVLFKLGEHFAAHANDQDPLVANRSNTIAALTQMYVAREDPDSFEKTCRLLMMAHITVPMNDIYRVIDTIICFIDNPDV